MFLQLLETTLPIFIVILVGYIAARTQFIDSSTSKVLANIVFYIVMPAAIFLDISKSPIAQVLNWRYMSAYFITAILLISVAFLISKFVFKRSFPETVMSAMASYHVNTAFLALPIFIALFNTVVPVASILILQSFFTVTILLCLESSTVGKIQSSLWKRLMFILLGNPILIAIFLGLTAGFLQLHLPLLVDSTLELFKNAAAFLALFALGISLAARYGFSKAEIAEVSLLVFLKSLLHPIVAFLVGGFVFHLQGQWLQFLVLMCAMPSAKNLFIIAQKYEVATKRSRLLVFMTTLLSFFTINLVLLLFSNHSVG